MAPSPSPETVLAAGDRELLLDLADEAIVEGLLGRRDPAPLERRLTPALRRHRGVFVTLTVADELNGCIGSIEGVEALGRAASRHAWSAAFADPRLPALRSADYPELNIEVSVLSPLAPMAADSRHAVLDGLRPGVDGLVIAEGRRRGVFLPSVWKQLPEPDVFLDHLQAKAGIRPDTWPATMLAWRFTATKFARPANEQPNPSAAA
jgi:AmmeMemoRadiSam system protein A